MLKYDPNWYQWTSYVNVMATYPLALLGAKGPQVGAASFFIALGALGRWIFPSIHSNSLN
jgi:hypothetical protein